MSAFGLEHAYLTRKQLAARSASWWEDVLGVVGFEGPPDIAPESAPIAASMTPPLGGAEVLCEVWRVTGDRTSAPICRRSVASSTVLMSAF